MGDISNAVMVDNNVYEEEYDDAYDSEEEQEEDNESSAAVTTNQDDLNNPYWMFELVFLAACGVGIVMLFIYVQKKEWLETIQEMNEQRLNKRKYGFNRINFVFDTEDTSDSDDYSDVDALNKKQEKFQERFIDNQLDLRSGDEHHLQ